MRRDAVFVDIPAGSILPGGRDRKPNQSSDTKQTPDSKTGSAVPHFLMPPSVSVETQGRYPGKENQPEPDVMPCPG
ncbi:hypothetical protein D1157_04225 [Anaerotruncus sp. X29]|nr:hypothetical protein [Anaerotruncus sp. X29]RKJ99966.1 hypothetical protein D7Y41_04130 [Anaerotruncus sp. 1XD22-93]